MKLKKLLSTIWVGSALTLVGVAGTLLFMVCLSSIVLVWVLGIYLFPDITPVARFIMWLIPRCIVICYFGWLLATIIEEKRGEHKCLE